MASSCPAERAIVSAFCTGRNSNTSLVKGKFAQGKFFQPWSVMANLPGQICQFLSQVCYITWVKGFQVCTWKSLTLCICCSLSGGSESNNINRVILYLIPIAKNSCMASLPRANLPILDLYLISRARRFVAKFFILGLYLIPTAKNFVWQIPFYWFEIPSEGLFIVYLCYVSRNSSIAFSHIRRYWLSYTSWWSGIAHMYSSGLIPSSSLIWSLLLLWILSMRFSLVVLPSLLIRQCGRAIICPTCPCRHVMHVCFALGDHSHHAMPIFTNQISHLSGTTRVPGALP